MTVSLIFIDLKLHSILKTVVSGIKKMSKKIFKRFLKIKPIFYFTLNKLKYTLEFMFYLLHDY